MADLVTIEAEARQGTGKGGARAIRRASRLPGVIYGPDSPNLSVSLDPKSVLREIGQAGWRSRIFGLHVGTESMRALIREVQLDPVTDRPIHVDFQRLVAGRKVHVSIGVLFKNEGASPGVKRGGVLNIVRHTVEVMCDPDQVPERFHADLSGLDINDTVRWSDLQGTEGVHPVIGRNFVVATIAPPTKMAEAVEETAAAAATATTAATAPAAAATPAAPAPAPAAKAPAAAKASGKKGASKKE